jgi:hypothetical protein
MKVDNKSHPHGHDCDVCRDVWKQLESDPEFTANMRRAEKDFEEGRWYTFDTVTGETHPNPDWPKDGPQPTHH